MVHQIARYDVQETPSPISGITSTGRGTAVEPVYTGVSSNRLRIDTNCGVPAQAVFAHREYLEWDPLLKER